MLGQGTYVLGIEPANCHVEGRARERERETLEYLAPGDKKRFQLELGVLESPSQFRQAREEIKSLISL
jgi:hypothetical protein